MSRNVSNNTLNLLPLGIPTLIIADDPQLIAAAETAYAYWSAEAPFPEARIELRLEIGNASPSADICFDIAVEGSRLSLSGAGTEGSADAATLKARARMAPELVDDLAAFTDILDTLLLFLLARGGRTPVHASAFTLGDLAVVLAGPSGSGKSTLALAAAEGGQPVLSDDMVFVQREPSFALWGFPRPIHLFPSDAPAGHHPTRWRNGKLKAAIPLTAPALKAERAVLVLLERGDELDVQQITEADAIEPLMQLDAGFDLLEAESRMALEALASNGAWRLSLTDDPAAAIDLVVSHFAAQFGIGERPPVDFG